MSLIDDGNQQQTPGGTESPTSSPSVSNGQRLSNVDALVKRVEELEKANRGLQKGIDKRFERQDSNIKRILELKEQGLNESQIARELWIDQQIQGQEAPPQPPVGNERARQATDTGSAFSVADAIAEIEGYNLPVDGSDVINLLRDKQLSKEKVKDYILGKVKPPKPANPADVVQAPAARKTDTGPAQLKANYDKEIANIAQTMRGDAKIKAISDLKVKYREAGLQI